MFTYEITGELRPDLGHGRLRRPVRPGACVYALNPRNRGQFDEAARASAREGLNRCPLSKTQVDSRHRHRHHRPRVGRHPGAEHAAAALVAVAVLRLHRLGHRLRHRLSGDPAGLQLHQGPARLRQPRRDRRRHGGAARRSAAPVVGQIESASLADIEKNPQDAHGRPRARQGRLRHQLRALPRPGGAGRASYPNLESTTSGSGAARWTRSTRPSSTASATRARSPRQGPMPAFGKDGIIPKADIPIVAAYVVTLSGRKPEGTVDLAKGKAALRRELRRLPWRRRARATRRSARRT